jgi:excisionase family DNA binding protein
VARDQGVGALVWSPLGWGRLTGKIRRGEPLPEGSRLHGSAEFGPPVDEERSSCNLLVFEAHDGSKFRGCPQPHEFALSASWRPSDTAIETRTTTGRRAASPGKEEAMAETQQLPHTLTVEKAGELLGISRRSAYRAAARGDLPTLRLGRRLLVPTAPLLALLGVSDEDVQLTTPPAQEVVSGR